MKSTVIQNDASLIHLDRVSLGYPGTIALSEVSFTVQRGEFVGVIGPNGSGKSTLIKGLLGLIPIYRGTLELFGECPSKIKPYRAKIGYVPQKNKNEAKFPVTVKEVVMMGLYAQIGWFKRPVPRHWEEVERSLQLVEMASFANHPFSQLSGGQQQRVIIARALVARPELLILDEPTSAVDITAQAGILEILERLNREAGITILMVTHDINEIVHFCDKVLLLNKKLCGFGAPDQVLTKERLAPVYGSRVFIYHHNGHPHFLVGDFDS
ncbi:MAG TPA: metal ABC transporter ATP-binding protein [Bacillota bacterium]|nr:metal ABC transporter ATP-binding protein [Bacillota bacterium]